MDLLSNEFDNSEFLYRAVRPNDMFWKGNGKVSSAAFKDSAGLSVQRGYMRNDNDVVDEIRRLDLIGDVVKVTVLDCRSIEAIVRYLPSRRSIYHSEIHGSDDRIILNNHQCKVLSDVAILVNENKKIS